MSDPFAHILAQLKSNIQFLAAHNYIPPHDAALFLAKLPQSVSVVYARALWPYSEDPNDLSFAAGDVIEIIEETNADWWMGKVHGKQALFPSSYVEKIPAGAPAQTGPTPPPRGSEKAVYRPFGAALGSSNAPPPPGEGVNSVGLQRDPAQDQKKNKFGKYGNTMAHSAAGGVGFGAGSAIGGGLVRAIF